MLGAEYLEYAWTHLRRVPRPGYPSEGWVIPPCPSTALGVLSLSKDIWTFLSSLREVGLPTGCQKHDSHKTHKRHKK